LQRAQGTGCAGQAWEQPLRPGHPGVWPGDMQRTTIMDVRDSNGAILVEGDNVTLIKDLKVKGTSETLKRGTMIKGIHLTEEPDEVECRHAKIKGLVLRTEFLKKA
jgi:protein PhnA